VDESGGFLGREDRLLISSSSLSLKDAWRLVSEHGGLLIPAHVNRVAFGLLPVLGFVPQDIPLEILEISHHISPEKARAEYPQLAHYHLIQNGDAHQLGEIIGFNIFRIEKPLVSEIIQAILGLNGRSYRCISNSTTK
jgi:hypothetical protein